MNVERILSEKGTAVVTMRPERTLADAIATLGDHRIGAVVIVGEDEGVMGIVSERDIVRALADSGGDALSEPVSGRMTREVVTCTPAAEIPELMSLMTTGKFRHVPVVENGRLGGIVSIGDIVKHRLAEVEAEHRALRDYIATA